MDLDYIVYENCNIDSDGDSMLFRLLASTIPKWRTFKVLSCVHIWNRCVDFADVVYEVDNIDSEIYSMLFPHVASTISKFLTFKLLRCV
jgi:hypothetical protein